MFVLRHRFKNTSVSLMTFDAIKNATIFLFGLAVNENLLIAFRV